MASPQPRRRFLRSVWKPAAGTIFVGVLATLAVVNDGYDAQQVPRLETNVWVTRDNGQYARVNTELGDIDTVRFVADPVGVVQAGAAATILTQGYSQSWPIDPAAPADFGSSDGSASGGAAAINTPSGTKSVSSAGDYMAFLTASGQVYLGNLPKPGGARSVPWQANPFADDEVKEGEEPRLYVANAAAVDAAGRIVMYSSEDQGVRSYDILEGRFDGGVASVPEPPDTGAEVDIQLVGGRWVLSSPADGRVWIEGLGKPVDTTLAGGAVLQQGSADGDRVLLADDTGLVGIQMKKGTVERLAEAKGTPAAPVVVDGVAYAAWISTSAAYLWISTETGVRALEVDTAKLAEVQNISPAFRSNGDRAVLTETATGMVWTLPDRALIPVSSWDALEEREQVEGTVVVEDVIEQKPPVAVADTFGVRRGEQVNLPLLLNDHDPNKKDVLTIDPASVTALSDPSFGQLGLVSEDQAAVVRVSAASGSATFTYAVTDGYEVSAQATVTLTVIDGAANSAPIWCGVPECTLDPPSPQVTPGGYVSVAALNGWVDPEGDAIAISEVRPEDPQAPLTVVATADGKVVVRHSDPNAGDGVIPLTVTVIDARGASSERTLNLRVSASPALNVRPIASSGSVEEHSSVSISDFVSGGSGSYRLLAAVASPASSSSLSIAPGMSNGVIEMTATAPGRHFALYTVEDTKTLAQQTATVRYTVADATRPLTVPPLVAFVRAGEDVTVDVLASAQNTTGRVLMVAAVSSSTPELSVSVVGQAYVRVSGSTLSGEPGRVGVATIVVADGAGGTTSTQLTVLLLPSSHGIGPIAAPDSLSVRAGAQIDIPVLANDVSPLGERLLLRPEIEGSGAAGELAFVSGAVVRYLAPTTPGTYPLRYSAYLENDPGRFDSATVTVTVLPAGSNRAPTAPTLTARVLAGQSVSIPVLGAASDPDGDPIVTTDVGQPAPGDGVSLISAQGDAIVYHAPADGVSGGQVTFSYAVTDTAGAEATGVVQVGVLSRDNVDVAPITYSDYIGVRLGSDAPVNVRPLLNDRDPLGGALELIKVVPNAPENTTEYKRLLALLDTSTSLKEGVVALLPGDVEGTQSYVYTVQSDTSFNTAAGLIVLGVSNEPAPDSLQVSDTILTLSNRDELATGIDVVTGKTQWHTGDASKLTLSLWGDAAKDFQASGWRISGSLPAESTVVPFALSGVDATGNAVTSYGFLRIPAVNDMRVQLRADATPVQLGEEKSVEIPVREFLDVGASDVVEMRPDEPLAVQRDQAVCSPTGTLAVTYSARREAPWTDSCSVAVRLTGQTVWSVVALPIIIQPKDPQAILNPIFRTVVPGETEVVNLVQAMITWEGGRVDVDSSLNLVAAHSGAAFIVAQEGDQVTATARSTARPGTRETIRVTSSAYGGLTGTITLEVGKAAPDAPKGATFTQPCDVSRGASCQLTVVGVGGEYDPFAGKPDSGLSLVSVGTAGSVTCPVATVTRASPTQVVATWPSGPRPVGGECVVDYTVSDAQGRTGHGTLTIDVLGYPQTPASVTTINYDPTTVTLLVNLGPASQAHPAVSGATIWQAGAPVATTCTPSGPGAYQCVVGGLTNGQPHTYTARAVNSIGESLDTTGHTTWSYQPPVITSLTAQAVYDGSQTTTTQGVVAVDIGSSDDTDTFTVVNTNGTIERTGTNTPASVILGVGDQVLDVIPVSKYRPPTGGGGSGTAQKVAVTVVGAPYYEGGVTATPNGPEITITSPDLNPNHSSVAGSQVWVAWTGDKKPGCTMNNPYGIAVVTGGSAVQSTSKVIGGLVANKDYYFGVCGANGFGATLLSSSETVFTWVPPAAPTGTLTYSVATVATAPHTGHTYTYVLAAGPSVDPLAGFDIAFRYNGGAPKVSRFDLDAEVNYTLIETAYCVTKKNVTHCGDWAKITTGGAPTTVTVTFPSECVKSPAKTDVVVSGPADAEAHVVPGPTDYTVSWPTGVFNGLKQLSVRIDYCAGYPVQTPPSPPPALPPPPGP